MTEVCPPWRLVRQTRPRREVRVPPPPTPKIPCFPRDRGNVRASAHNKGFTRKIQQGAGTLRFDAIGGKRVHHVEQSDLDIHDRVQRREVQFADFGTAAEFGALLGAFYIALVKIAKGLSTESGRTTED